MVFKNLSVGFCESQTYLPMSDRDLVGTLRILWYVNIDNFGVYRQFVFCTGSTPFGNACQRQKKKCYCTTYFWLLLIWTD